MTKAKTANKPAAKQAAPVDIQMIPLSKLVLSPKNVRKTPSSAESDAELFASIRETGLKQNLLVHQVGAKFHVHAGGRRLAALQKLKQDGVVKAGHPVPCQVEDPDQAEDTSAAENLVRAPMHAADQFEAFAALRAKGRTEVEVAAQFGITQDLVRRRLKLASVAPEIMELFRQDEMSLDCVMAFTLTDDHARQLEVWELVKNHYNPAHTIRNHLTQKGYSGASKLAKFVGIEAYKAAGGAVLEDLFSERENMHLEDSDLLEKLAEDKLQTLAKDVAKIWKWADVQLQTDYDSFRPFGRVYPEPLEPDPELEAEFAKLAERKDALESEYDEEDWTDELDEELDKIYDRLEEIEELRNANVAYTADQHRIAGCVVSVSHSGDVQYHEGLVRPEDIPQPAQDPGAKAADDADAEDADNADQPAIELPQSMRPTSVSLNAAAAARKAQGIPQALADDLRATRHQILQSHLAADYAVAYDVMLYSMVCNTIGHRSASSPLDQTLRPAMTIGAQEQLKETVAAKMLEALEARLNLDWVKAKAPEDFHLFCQLPDADKQALFAWCASYALKQQLSNDHSTNPVIEAIGARLDVNVAACWRPNAENYWSRVNKAHALETAKSLISEQWADNKSGLRKPELAKSMAEAFSENPVEAAGLTATAASATATWLPDGMAFSVEAPVDVNAGNADDETPVAEADDIPDYLQDVA